MVVKIYIVIFCVMTTRNLLGVYQSSEGKYLIFNF
jgi:hypothetical protein